MYYRTHSYFRLMRAMLDAHPEVRCGEETRVVPRILQMRAHWMKSTKESMRLEEAGLNGEVLDSALSAFILEVVAKHGEPAPRLCNKDPFTLKSGTYLRRLFPKGKFLFMVRDGRATVHSIITRKVTITGFDLKSYRQCLTKWNAAITAMNDQCKELGPDHCLKVPYEQLVLHPRKWMENILEFLDLLIESRNSLWLRKCFWSFCCICKEIIDLLKAKVLAIVIGL